MTKPQLKITLYGRFRVEDETGSDLTPTGTKTQALLALVASSPSLDRSRTWLQDKLWSDRGPEQGSASLRQALSELRKTLGKRASLLITNRQRVRLDTDRIVLSGVDGSDSEFLEGIDCRDPEFNHWLTSKRAAGGMANSPAAPPAVRTVKRQQVLFLCNGGAPTAPRFVEDTFVETVSKSIQDLLNVEILNKLPDESEPGLLIVNVHAVTTNTDEVVLRVVVEDVDAHRRVWSDAAKAGSVDALMNTDVQVLNLSNRLVATLTEVILRGRAGSNGDPNANLLALLAHRKMFSMDVVALSEADEMLQTAFEIEERAVFRAWLAQLYCIQFVERAGADLQELGDRSGEMCAYALEADPANSNVLCAAANAKVVLQKNYTLGAELAAMSVRADKANPYGWWALSAASLYLGRLKAAHNAASNAQRLGAGTKERYWTDFQRSLTAATLGRTREAIRYGELASALAPSFRPPLRYLVGLYSRVGDQEKLQRAATKLQRLEPDFSIERLISDPHYPASILRNYDISDQRTLLSVNLAPAEEAVMGWRS